MSKYGTDGFRRPELAFAELINRAVRGDEDDRHYYRAVVLAVDLDGGQLQNESGTGGFSSRGSDGKVRTFQAHIGPSNPRGSIKARVLTSGLDRLLSDDDLRIYWPMFPQDQMGLPVSPGEHVYVVFEGAGTANGLWLSRVTGHESANSFKGSNSYTAPSAPRSAVDAFEPNRPQYDTTDEHAGLAPPVDLTGLFGDKDV